MSCKVLTAVLVGALAIAGCAPVDPGMGEAAKYDAYVQTVNPEPVYAASGAQPGGGGDHGVAATERYRKGQVKEPVRETSAGSGSGGSR